MQENSNPSNTQEAVKSRKHTTFNTESDPILFLHLLRKNFRWFLLIIISCIVAVLIYLRYTVPVYESHLTFQVGTLNTANQLLNVDNFHEANSIEKDIEILKSQLLFKRALSKLPLAVSYYNKGKILNHELYKSSPFELEYKIKDSTIIGRQFGVSFKEINSYDFYEGEEFVGSYSINELVVTNRYQFKIIPKKDKVNEI
ncbi:MAG: hypothetical protein KDD29_04450, partial [Flavobacteriales bacterium]|nr:hypothetical protein [Flavobacteriales bacterium]